MHQNCFYSVTPPGLYNWQCRFSRRYKMRTKVIVWGMLYKVFWTHVMNNVVSMEALLWLGWMYRKLWWQRKQWHARVYWHGKININGNMSDDKRWIRGIFITSVVMTTMTSLCSHTYKSHRQLAHVTAKCSMWAPRGILVSLVSLVTMWLLGGKYSIFHTANMIISAHISVDPKWVTVLPFTAFPKKTLFWKICFVYIG